MVQLVLNSIFSGMMESGKNLMKKCMIVSWTVDPSNCMEIILQQLTN